MHTVVMVADGYTLDELRFEWRRNEKELQIDADLELPQFTLSHWTSKQCEKSYITGQYQSVPVSTSQYQSVPVSTVLEAIRCHAVTLGF